MKLKRFFALMLALTLSLTMLQGVAFAATGYSYKSDPFGKATLTIDGVHEGKVTVADADAFFKNFARATVTHVVIKSGVTSIEADVFLGCTNLTSITFDGTPTNISNTMFGAVDIEAFVDNPAPISEIIFNVNYNKDMVDQLIAALKSAGRTGGSTPTMTDNGWSDVDKATLQAVRDELKNIDPGSGGGAPPEGSGGPPEGPDDTVGENGVSGGGGGSTPTGGSSGSTGTGTGAWYIGTGVPYTQIVDETATTAMLRQSSTITVTGTSPTGIIVKVSPASLSVHSTVTIQNSLQGVTLTATQIAQLINLADGGSIHITVKQTQDGISVYATAGGVQVHL